MADLPPPPFASFTSSTNDLTAPGSFTLTATLTDALIATAYSVRIIDDDNNAVLATCSSGSSCSATVYQDWILDGTTRVRHFHADEYFWRLGTYATSSPADVTVRPVDWSVSLAADSPQVTVGKDIQLTATTNRTVSSSPYQIVIVDDDSGQALATCGSGTTCTATASSSWDDNANPGVRRFHAQVQLTASQAIEATSEQVSVNERRQTYAVSLSFSGPDSSGRYTGTATAAPTLVGTPWRLRIYASNGTVAAECGSTPCSATLSPGMSYRAKVENIAGDAVFGASSTWLLTASGAEEQTADGLDVATLAAILPGLSDTCDLLLGYPGTHLADSSVSDQELACQAALDEGLSVTDALKRIAAAAGGGTAVLWWLNREGTQRYLPGPIPTPGTAPAASPPVAALPDAWPVQGVADSIMERRTSVTQAAADAMAKACLWQTAAANINGATACETLPIFSSGADVAEATLHDLETLAKRPGIVQLDYDDPDAKVGARDWYASYPECESPQTGQSCDEYPFFATLQGGPAASPLPDLKLIASNDNSYQGLRLGNFSSSCGLKASGGHPPFLAVPLSLDLGLTTSYVCGAAGG